MGREVVKMVLNDPELQLVGAIDMSSEGLDVGVLVGSEACGVQISNDMEMMLVESNPDVIVDFTTPHSVIPNAKLAIKHGYSDGMR